MCADSRPVTSLRIRSASAMNLLFNMQSLFSRWHRLHRALVIWRPAMHIACESGQPACAENFTLPVSS
jgi:hypothetical protein